MINHKTITTFIFLIILSFTATSQSPKKYLKNGFHEKAFVEAVYKQNKKVKLKKKHVEIINESYEIIYSKHRELILSSETNWQESYNPFIRVTNFRARVTHPGVYDNLTNIILDKIVLQTLANKFNQSNLKDLEISESYESVNKFIKALEIYGKVKLRHEQATAVSTLEDKLILIDYETKIANANNKIGDQFIAEAKLLLEGGSKMEAESAIKLIQKAKSYRELDLEENELLTLANLIIGESWLTEAKKLIETRTKKNARLAYELINRARSVKTLSPEEEELLEQARMNGMTNILVKTNEKVNHSSQSLAGILNNKKGSQWIAYYNKESDVTSIDFEMTVTENKPKVILGDTRKRVTQNTKTVEYWEKETDAEGNTTKVKKTKNVVGIVAILSKTKSSYYKWSINLTNPNDGMTIYSEDKETVVEYTNEFASIESGDVMALPDNIESEVNLDSQPFPEDEAMLNEVKNKYLDELISLIKEKKDYMRNINLIID